MMVSPARPRRPSEACGPERGAPRSPCDRPWSSCGRENHGSSCGGGCEGGRCASWLVWDLESRVGVWQTDGGAYGTGRRGVKLHPVTRPIALVGGTGAV